MAGHIFMLVHNFMAWISIMLFFKNYSHNVAALVRVKEVQVAVVGLEEHLLPHRLLVVSVGHSQGMMVIVIILLLLLQLLYASYAAMAGGGASRPTGHNQLLPIHHLVLKLLLRRDARLTGHDTLVSRSIDLE